MMLNKVITDQQLLVALAMGDRKATSEIYKKNYPVVKGWIIKSGGTEADCADIFQEALVVLFSKAQDENFRLSCAVGTYLFAVSKHFWFKKMQKSSRDPSFSMEDMGNLETAISGVESDLNAHYEREEHFELLNSALDQVGEPCRSLLRAFYHQDKSMQEISAAFGYTNAENAKTQKYKCLNRLKKIFFNMQAK